VVKEALAAPTTLLYRGSCVIFLGKVEPRSDRRMLREFLLTGAAAAALFFPISADAGSAITTNPGARYVPYGGVGRFHTNPGGKYVYRGYGEKFHTNPGGKYVYPNWSKWQPGGPMPLTSKHGAGRSTKK